MILILFFCIFVPHLDGHTPGDECVNSDKQNGVLNTVKGWFASDNRIVFSLKQTLQYESFHDYATFQVSMKYQDCNDDVSLIRQPRIEDRQRNFVEISSNDGLIDQKSISKIGEIWKIANLKPCQNYKLKLKYSVDIVDPFPQYNILPLAHLYIKISTAPILLLKNEKIRRNDITLVFDTDCDMKLNFYANLIRNEKVVQNKTMHGQTISFSDLSSDTEYNIIIEGNKKEKLDSTTDIFVVFPKIFYHKFKTLPSTDAISQIDRNESSLKTSPTKQFYDVTACDDFIFTEESRTIISHRLTRCQCPVKQSFELKKTMTDPTIKITWPSVETKSNEFLCGIQDYVVYVHDLERTRSSNNYYELPFCHSLDVKIVAMSYENIVLAEGAINITEFHEQTLKTPKLHFELGNGNLKFKPIFTPIIDEKFEWCNFEVTQKISAVDTFKPCTLNNITLETTLNGNKLDPKLITIETPIQEIKISDVDSSPIVKFCSEYSKFLTYHLKVTWIEFVAESNCDEEVPQEKEKVYNSTGFDLKLDELISNSKYNLILEVFHVGYGELVFASQKIIETSQLDVHKIRDVKINVEFEFEETCQANIKLTWTKPCTKDVKNYQVVFGLEENADIIAEYTTNDEFALFSNQNCSRTYKICINTENYKETEPCRTVKALPSQLRFMIY
uniref:CSON014302 protein n=1 Tax=Culicoides sonorensis TaxID=179676 RepID=A0A336LNQ6_CULSO